MSKFFDGPLPFRNLRMDSILKDALELWCVPMHHEDTKCIYDATFIPIEFILNTHWLNTECAAKLKPVNPCQFYGAQNTSISVSAYNQVNSANKQKQLVLPLSLNMPMHIPHDTRDLFPRASNAYGTHTALNNRIDAVQAEQLLERESLVSAA